MSPLSWHFLWPRLPPSHPAWMLGIGTLLWLAEMLVVLHWHLNHAPELTLYATEWLAYIVLNGTAALWFSMLWAKALRWRLRRSQRVPPEVRAERERIAQDLHDGVGSHLVRALAILDAPSVSACEVREALEHAMFSLRVEMEALDDADATLVERLASMRWRLQPLLTQRGMRMQWHIPLEEQDDSPRGDTGTQLALLAQEAMSNAVQHSAGKVLRVSLQKSEKMWVLEVADDGCGIDADALPASKCAQIAAKRGWGLDGMRARALRLDARFELESIPHGGTCIRVSMPAQAHFCSAERKSN